MAASSLFISTFQSMPGVELVSSISLKPPISSIANLTLLTNLGTLSKSLELKFIEIGFACEGPCCWDKISTSTPSISDTLALISLKIMYAFLLVFQLANSNCIIPIVF